MATNRVFITGRSALTATGSTADMTWDALLAGKNGIDTITQWDMSNVPYQLGAELKDFQPAKMLTDRKLIKVISRHDVMGINAGTQAVENSNMLTYRDSLANPEAFNDQTAVYVGSPGNKFFQQYDFLPLLAKTNGDMQSFANQLFENVHPMWLLRILPNNVLAYTGITYGFKGVNHNITNHAVSGTQAVLEAYHAIKSGQAERAIVIAYDIGMEPQSVYHYSKLGILSSNHLKPFDKDRDGTILAEGAAAIVLESEASVKERNAKCYSEMLGGFSGSEAVGLFSIHAESEHLKDTITSSLKRCNITPAELSFIVAHGNGNQMSEDSEAHAIHQIYGDQTPPITAFKWSMGHTLCASGILDTVLASYALNNHCIPGIANLNEAAIPAQGLNISASSRSLSQSHSALIVSRGFASMNACLVIKNCA